MKTFITSVRLKDAENPDYERLDREMEKERFAKVKPPKAKSRAAAGERTLPVTREYNYLGGISLQAVTEAAYRAAHRTGKQYTFTVIKQKTL